MKERITTRRWQSFPIGSVMKLNARQISVIMRRSGIDFSLTGAEGNRRMYSLDDMDCLLEIKDYQTASILADIRRNMRKERANQGCFIGQEEIRKALLYRVTSAKSFRLPSPYGQFR